VVKTEFYDSKSVNVGVALNKIKEYIYLLGDNDKIRQVTLFKEKDVLAVFENIINECRPSKPANNIGQPEAVVRFKELPQPKKDFIVEVLSSILEYAHS
jgi:hypothetical protein